MSLVLQLLLAMLAAFFAPLASILGLGLPAGGGTPPPPVTGTPPPGTTTNADQMAEVVDLLSNIRDNGFNTKTDGLYINWRYGQANQVNMNGTGMPDADPATRHDPQTDLRYLMNLLRYKQLEPNDHQFDADITKFTGIIKQEFANTVNPRGWVYFILEAMATSSGDAWYSTTAHTLAESYMSGNSHTDRYDWSIEEACVLIVDGKAHNDSKMTQTGQSFLDAAWQKAYNSQYHLIISRNEVKAGEIGEEVEALAEAGDMTRAQDLMQGAQIMWDNDKGGFFAKVDFTSGKPVVQTTKKEGGRQAEMLRAALLIGDTQLAQKLTAVVTGPVYYKAGHGILYEQRADWSLEAAKSVPEDWVTTEAMGIVVEALLALQ